MMSARSEKVSLFMETAHGPTTQTHPVFSPHQSRLSTSTLTGNSFQGTGSLWREKSHLPASLWVQHARSHQQSLLLPKKHYGTKSQYFLFKNTKTLKTPRGRVQIEYLNALKTWNPFIPWVTFLTLRKQAVPNFRNHHEPG